jgi:hypothetical protein
MLSEQLLTISELLRRNANLNDGQLCLSSKTTDILLSNLQFLSDDIRRYGNSDRGMDVLSPAMLAIIRELSNTYAKCDPADIDDAVPYAAKVTVSAARKDKV